MLLSEYEIGYRADEPQAGEDDVTRHSECAECGIALGDQTCQRVCVNEGASEENEDKDLCE